ncbi:MAG: four helix bundle protein [Bacteroidota bacterium]
MKSQPEILRDRTKQFAIQIVRLVRTFPKNEEARIIGRQLMRSATSVAANYRAVCRARSKAEFIAKIGIVVEEADETVFWLEMVTDLNILSPEKTNELLKEANELIAIFSASNQTARGRR